MPETPTLPGFLTRCANDEFVPPLLVESERHAAHVAAEEIDAASSRLRLPPRAYTESRRGTAAGLLAVNEAAGESFFDVPSEAALDAAAADEALGGEQLIIDIQTHYIADRGACETNREIIRTIYPVYGPDWWGGCSEVQQLDLVEYLRCVYLESDTAVAVLSSAPGLSESRMLFNEEMAATRLLMERLGADGRLLNHAVVHPGVDGEIESMLEVHDRIGPVGWKVYTIGAIGATDADDVGAIDGWYLDDDTGEEFLEQVSASGVPIVCAHKGVSGLVPTGSPRDFGPAASRHPDISFVAYHSGFEPGTGEPTEETREGPFTEATADVGVNRLVKTLLDHGVALGSNVYAELGTTWYCLVKRPLEAAHVLGKLLNAVGEDNVLWGTDAIWYGPTQTAVDTFRAFQIPAWMRDEFGYPELTPAVKEKVLGLNAARVYGIDVESARSHMGSDDVQWARDAMAEYRASGTPTF